MLNFIQALIFSVLTLMFIVLAIESHHHEEGEIAGGGRRVAGGSPDRSPPRPTTRPPSGPQDPGTSPEPRQEEPQTWNTSAQASRPSGVIGPGIGIGILGGLAASAIGRNPDAASQIRGLAIILAALRRRPRRAGDRGRPARDLHQVEPRAATVGILAVAWRGRSGRRSASPVRRRERRPDDQPLLDHHLGGQLHRVRRPGLVPRLQARSRAPWSAPRAHRAGAARTPTPRAGTARPAAEQRQAIAGRGPAGGERDPRACPAAGRGDARAGRRRDARAEIERLREQAVTEIDAERQRALADVRAQVADLALARRRQGRRRDHDRPARAPAGRRVPGPGERRARPAASAATRQGATDGRPQHRPAVRRGGVRDRPSATARSSAWLARPGRRRGARSAQADAGAFLANPAIAVSARHEVAASRSLGDARLATGAQPGAAAHPARPDRAAARGRAGVPTPRTTAGRASSERPSPAPRRSTTTEVAALDDAARPSSPAARRDRRVRSTRPSSAASSSASGTDSSTAASGDASNGCATGSQPAPSSAPVTQRMRIHGHPLRRHHPDHQVRDRRVRRGRRDPLGRHRRRGRRRHRPDLRPGGRARVRAARVPERRSAAWRSTSRRRRSAR